MGVTQIYSVSLSTSLLDREAGRRREGGGGGDIEKKEISDPEVRGQGSSPDYRSIEEVQPGRPPLDFLSSQLYGFSAAPFTPWRLTSPRC